LRSFFSRLFVRACGCCTGILHRILPIHGTAFCTASSRHLMARLQVAAIAPVWDRSRRNTTNGSRFPNEIKFCQVCHCEFALLFALLGGVIGSLAPFRYHRQAAP